MKILSIDTSCDETSVAVTEERRVLGNAIYSQILIHKKWGGVVPSLAKRAHEERIDFVIQNALKKAKLTIKEIEAIAVTQGPGLAVALEVGIKKAKELAIQHKKKLVAVNHMEGHIYSCFVQNKNGNPPREFQFPYLALLVSGGHTEFVLFQEHLQYKEIGVTLDDAAGESLDKAAKMLGFGYPGGEVIERISKQVGFVDTYKFPRPMVNSNNLDFSFSGLKTSLFYFLQKLSDEEKEVSKKIIASSFQEAVFDTLFFKTKEAIKITGIRNLIVGGGVIANQYLRLKFRALMKKQNGFVLFPPYKYLTGDNAAMIGIAASFYAKKGLFVKSVEQLDRVPRLHLSSR